jgi:hypothetical protein
MRVSSAQRCRCALCAPLCSLCVKMLCYYCVICRPPTMNAQRGVPWRRPTTVARRLRDPPADLMATTRGDDRQNETPRRQETPRMRARGCAGAPGQKRPGHRCRRNHSLGVSWRLGVFAFSPTNPRRRRTTIVARNGETKRCQQITPHEPNAFLGPPAGQTGLPFQPRCQQTTLKEPLGNTLAHTASGTAGGRILPRTFTCCNNLCLFVHETRAPCDDAG